MSAIHKRGRYFLKRFGCAGQEPNTPWAAGLGIRTSYGRVFPGFSLRRKILIITSAIKIQVDSSLSFTQIKEGMAGKTVMLGGDVLAATRLKDRMRLTIVQFFETG